MERMKQENPWLISLQTERESLTEELQGLRSHLAGEAENRILLQTLLLFQVLTEKCFSIARVHRFGEGAGGGIGSHRVPEDWKANCRSETSDRQHLPQVSEWKSDIQKLCQKQERHDQYAKYSSEWRCDLFTPDHFPFDPRAAPSFISLSVLLSISV